MLLVQAAGVNANLPSLLGAMQPSEGLVLTGRLCRFSSFFPLRYRLVLLFLFFFSLSHSCSVWIFRSVRSEVLSTGG